MGEQNKMVLVSVANVQNYISASHNAKDLYYSSRNIGNLVKNIYDVLKKKLNGFETMPFNKEEEKKKIRTNFFLAQFYWEETSLDNVKIENKLKLFLAEDERMNSMPADLPVFIVVEDYIQGNDGYKDTYKRLYEKLQAYKNNRMTTALTVDMETSSQPFKVEDGKKIVCDLCGIRYAVKEDNKVYLCQECEKKQKQNKEGNKPDFYSVEDVAGENSKYYALVKMDIDDLGKYLSQADGENNLIDCQSKRIEKINKFSDEIDELFSKNENLISKDHNLLIYNGGDDILFFCPLTKILYFLIYIREQLKNKVDKNLTFSVSITIAYVKTPLKRVIELTSEKLDAVKKKFNRSRKNGTALTLIYGNYNVRSVYIRNNSSEIEPLCCVLMGMKENIVSSDLVQTMEQEFMRLGTIMHYTEGEPVKSIIHNEISRIVKRKIKDKDKDGEYERALRALYNNFTGEADSYFKQDLVSYFQLLHILEKWASEIEERSVDKKNAV